MLSSTVKRYMRDLVKIYFGLLKIQVKFWINFNATSLSTYDFSTLYTALPHLIKAKLIDLLKERTIEKALLTLHVTTETHFLLQKSLKISFIVLPKCM